MLWSPFLSCSAQATAPFGWAAAPGAGAGPRRPPHAAALVPSQVSVPPGALDCWVFLSCLEVLQRIEGCCDRAHLDANSAHTVGLWSYATEKVTAPPVGRAPRGRAGSAVGSGVRSVPLRPRAGGFGYLRVCLVAAGTTWSPASVTSLSREQALATGAQGVAVCQPAAVGAERAKCGACRKAEGPPLK